MPCIHIPFPGGGMVHVKMSAPRRRRCMNCMNRWASLECDFPVTRNGKPATCDRPLCRICAVAIAPEVDHCPVHPRTPQTVPQGQLAFDFGGRA